MRLLGFALLLLVTTSSLAVEETVKAVQAKCGKDKFKCVMSFSYENDCSEITEVVPRCTPKNKKCTKGDSISFATKSGCTVSGTFKSTGKKQTFTQVNVSPPPLEETVNVSQQVQCGKVTYQQCKMKVTYEEDCSSVSKVVPNCSPKKSKCLKGAPISFDTEKGCTVKGMYKNTGKKQLMSKLTISTTTSAPTTIAPTTIPGGLAEWSDWGDWIESDPASCSCGIGFKFRVRNCFAPSPDACDGDQTQTVPCTASESINQQTCQKPTTQG